MSNEFEVRRVTWEEAGPILRDIRTRVFVLEQGVSASLEQDGNDPDAYHFLGLLNGEPVACARLQTDGKISRMCVLPLYRGLHFARRILEEIIHEARELGLTHLYLHAQAHASGFYRKSGFEVVGEPFDEAEIPHIAMQRDI